jgi:sterol desaturase/sphingolipid hydroxylase (fatty acid hydroxylase superfamily)
MNYVLYAVPFFFLLIALELLADRWRGISTYRLADALNSLSAGVLSTTVGLLTKALGLLTYTFAWQHWGLVELSAQSLWVWLFAFVFYDFCYYWNHRLGHERNVLWAAHSVHSRARSTTCLRRYARPALVGFLAGFSICLWLCSACRRWCF